MSSFVSHWINYLKKHWALFLMLLLGLINGLIFVFLIPPWQHYDEPSQFEYAWLIANQPGLPKPDTYDQAMRRELAASMIEHDFFRGLNYKSNLLSVNEPVWIGISQINDAPLYYWLTALPLRLIRGTDITFQLYIARLVSLFLYLIIILASYGVMVELMPPGHPLRWMVPITLALLASFTNLMTAVNDDVGATVLLSLFLWVGIRSIRRGLSWLRSLELLILAVLSLYTKNTVAIAILLVPVVLLFSILRGSKRRIAWISLGIATIIGAFLTFTWGDAALWYRESPQDHSTRILDPRAPIGSHALALVQNIGAAPSRTVQIIPNTMIQALKGEKVSLGMWIWASKPARIRSPILDDGVNLYSRELDVGIKPSFFFVTATVDKNSKRLQIILSPQPSSEESQITVYYDGLILAAGDWPSDLLPKLGDVNGQQGYWGEKPFNNAIRNASFENGWFKARHWAESRIYKYFPISNSLILYSLIDWPVSKGYFLNASQQLFRTFWGVFGWGHVPLYGGRPYRLLMILTIVILGGVVIKLIHSRSALPWEILFLLGITFLFLWGATLIRGLNVLLGSMWIPSARYASPAIIPTCLIICVGWLEILRMFKQRTNISLKILTCLYFLFLVGLEIYSIISVVIFYTRHS